MISIVIPTYNRALTLSRVLDSFAIQSYPDWECIVVDDHSTDETKLLIRKYIDNDPRFFYTINTHTKGAQGARNTGIELAQGEWIALFDSDDYAYPNFLEELYKRISEGVDVITSKANMVDANTNKKMGVVDWCARGNILSDLLSGDAYVNFNGALLRKSALQQIGLLDTKCVSHQEYDTHIRLSKQCIYETTNMVLSDYYVNGADTISINKRKHYEGYAYILKKHSWIWRMKAYRSFLRKVGEIWFAKQLDRGDLLRLRIKLFIIAPEIILFLKRFRRKYNAKA